MKCLANHKGLRIVFPQIVKSLLSSHLTNFKTQPRVFQVRILNVNFSLFYLLTIIFFKFLHFIPIIQFTNQIIPTAMNPHQSNKNTLQNPLINVKEQLNPHPQSPHIERYRSFTSILTIITVIGLSSFYFGYAMVYLPAMDFTAIYSLYHIQITYEVAQGILVACIPIGGGLGALSTSLLIQKFSRRHSLLIVNCFAIVATLLLGIKNFQFFVLARLFQGYCTGLLSSIAPLMMKQLSPIEISGTLTSCHQILITCGATFGFLFSLLLDFVITSPSLKWTVLYSFSFVVIIGQSYLLMNQFKIQTPKYLLLNEQQEQAKQLVKIIYKDEYVDEVLKEMKDNLKHTSSKSEESLDERNTSDIELVEKNQGQFVKKQQITKKQQESPTHAATPRSAIVAALHLAILQQLCGVNAVVAYGGQIVGQRQPQLKMAMPIIINMLQFLGALFASILLTRLGRKFLLEMGALTTAIGAGIVGIGFMSGSIGWILFGLVFFMACFGITLGPVVWIYLPQVAQPNILSYATGVNWISCSLVMFLFPIVKKQLPNQNPATLFFFFAAWSMVSYFLNLKYIIETRNKGEKQINEEYRNLKTFV